MSDEAVRLAKWCIENGILHDSGPRIDVLARAVIALTEERDRLKDHLRTALVELRDRTGRILVDNEHLAEVIAKLMPPTGEIDD